MSLIFALLRENHIIFAADSRHVRGCEEARYLNDDCWKTQLILGNSAMIGFAGDDSVEQVIGKLQRHGDLERESLVEVAKKIGMTARERVNAYPQNAMPPMEFLLAGFVSEGGEKTATAFRLAPDNVFLPAFDYPQVWLSGS